MDFCSDLIKFSKGRHFAVKNFYHIKLDDVVENIRTLKIHNKKGASIHKTLT